MLTDETRAVFTRDIAAAQAHHNLPARAALLETTQRRHALYEARYTATVATLEAMEPKRRSYALARLRELGREGCMSGSLAYHQAVEALDLVGIREANTIFRHDRHAIVAGFKAGGLSDEERRV